MDKDVVISLKKRRDEILEEGRKIFIVNAGRMNHGKSSLFNSLLNKSVFAVDDIRTTMVRQDTDFDRDVVMVDTPGLDADIRDDKTAFDAYRHANLIIFVHTVKTGAVESDEIDSINRMAKEAASPEYFWRHFALVFSNIDEYDEDSVEDSKKMQLIEEESLRNIKTGCGEYEFPTFRVSNAYFSDGNEANSEQLLAMSGVRELKDYILTHLDEWRQEQAQLTERRFLQAKQEAMDAIESEHKTAADNMKAKENRLTDWKNSVEEKLGKFHAEIKDTHDAWRKAKAEQDKLESIYRLDCDAKNIFRSVNLNMITCVATPYIDRPLSDYNQDGFSSRDSAKNKSDKIREEYAAECNEFFRPRCSPSLCESLGEAYASQIYKSLSDMKSKLENAVRKAGKVRVLDDEPRIGIEVRMRGDDEWFGFYLDGKYLPKDNESYWAATYEEHFDRFITRFSGKVHRSDVGRSIDYYYDYESGWFGGEKKVKRYSFSLDFGDGQSEFDKVAANACEFLYREANLAELHRQIMDGLERSFQQKVIQKLANSKGMEVSISAAYDSKRRQTERLQNELQSNFRECLDGLCSLENVSDLPTVKDVQKRQSYYCENMGNLVSGVKSDIQERTLTELANDRQELARLDKIAAEIEAMQLDE